MLSLLQTDAPILLIIILAIWSIPWKGVALWKAARLSHTKWFVVLLIVNTVGILEIFYIFVIARKYSVKTEEVSDPVTK